MDLKQARQSKGMNQTDLARLAGISQQMLSMIELGERSLTVPVARKLAAVLGVKWYELIDGEEEAS